MSKNHNKHIVIIALTLLFSISGNANEAKIQDYINKANQYILSESQIAEQYIDSCKPYINSTTDKALVSKYYITSAKNDLSIGNFEQSIYILEKTITNLKHTKQDVDLAYAQFLLSTAYFYQTEYIKSIELAIESKRYYTKITDSAMIIKCTNLIGTVFFNLEQYFLASQHYKEVEKYAIANKNDTLLLTSMNNLAGIYISDSFQNIPLAIKYYHSAIGIAKRINKSYLPNMFANLGNAYIKIQDFNKADEYLKLALQYNTSNNSYLLSKIYFNLGFIAEQKQEYTSAKNYIEKSITESENINDFKELQDSFEKLSEIELNAKNYSKAIYYLKVSNCYNDSIIQQQQLETINGLKLKYNLINNDEQQESSNTINSLLQEKSRGLLYRKIGLSAFLLMLFIIIALRYRYSQKQKQTISHLKKLNQSLNEKNDLLDNTIKTRDKLISTIAHDIKNPLGTISGFAELLIMNNETTDSSKKLMYYKQIHSSATNLFTLLDNLVSWAKSQNHNIVTHPTEQNVAKLIDDNFTIFSEMAEAKNIKIINQCNSKHWVFADKHTLNTAIRNIINNAIKFTPVDGEILIKSEYKKNQIYLHIQDTGVGIKSQDIPLLFNANVDRDDIGKENSQNKGTGIGLVISQEFIKLNNGEIKVKSIENKGTCFTICLPTTPDSLIT